MKVSFSVGKYGIETKCDRLLVLEASFDKWYPAEPKGRCRVWVPCSASRAEVSLGDLSHIPP